MEKRNRDCTCTWTTQGREWCHAHALTTEFVSCTPRKPQLLHAVQVTEDNADTLAELLHQGRVERLDDGTTAVAWVSGGVQIAPIGDYIVRFGALQYLAYPAEKYRGLLRDYPTHTSRDWEDPMTGPEHYRKAEQLLAEVERLTHERDLAIAHDRQPYPTAHAYQAVCDALEKHRARADAAEAEVERLRGIRASLPLEMANSFEHGAMEMRERAARVALDQGDRDTAARIHSLWLHAADQPAEHTQ
ncbi:hypothetical protein CDO52_12810 [Nocardiopsis gilva YIM 90087]|uniref:Uncharacterized protein n=1 Tax=Nocardiopsis gilva YIM 90087 TaxID=1235441 RepID=A0A223S608_9ACTN|nr:hypothetical protein [Nocardiopsis gilva]ASU83550.1 hypothetical protein CDO52_12810 [Nocardiopsis gilva YIM 90087]